MAKCSFCGSEITRGTGLLYVLKEGNFYWFCSNKCRKNQLKLKRNPRKVKWTAAHRQQKQGLKETREKEAKGGKRLRKDRRKRR